MTNTLSIYQLTRDRARRNRLSSTRINTNKFITFYSELESVNSEPTTFDLELYQLDVKTTFLNGGLDETIYRNQPKGFELNTKTEKVCLLKMPLCGLKLALRQ